LTWDEVLKQARITDIIARDDDREFRHETLLVLDDGTFYRLRYPPRALEDFRIDWNGFVNLEAHAREAIVDALLSDRDTRRMMPTVLYVPRTVADYLSERSTSSKADLDVEQEQVDSPSVSKSEPSLEPVIVGISST
jgi:hypothetical protein